LDEIFGLTGSAAELEAYLNWLYERAKTIMNHEFHWRCIQAVARALLVKRRLSRAEVNELVTTTRREAIANKRNGEK